MKTVVFFILPFFLFFFACNENPKNNEFSGFGDNFSFPDSETYQEPEFPDSDSETLMKYYESDKKAYSVKNSIVNANTNFAVNIFKTILADEKDKNVFISPISLSIALSMTINGAGDKNYKEMEKALSLTGLSIEEVNSGFMNLFESFDNCDEDVALNLANSIWIAPDYKECISELFVETLENYYFSDVFEADCPDSINNWIKEQTNGKIEEVIKFFPEDLVMYLINAIYFKGNWTIPFDEQNTTPADFKKDDGSVVSVDMMKMDIHGKYTLFADEYLSGIRLSYGRDKIAFYAFKGKEEWSIDEYIEKLTAPYLNYVFNSFHEWEKESISIPKFKIEYEKQLNEIFNSLGMESAFQLDCENFLNMMNDSCRSTELAISNITHKSVIDVNEKGSEAAAATVVTIVTEGASDPFILNEPFFFVIRDDRNGTILFMGKVADPSL